MLYEQRMWEEASDMAQDIGLPEAAVTEMMNKATKWADELPVSFAK
jgi:EAL and modified HD-GYP domain-containing signal transduction protein